MMSLLIVDDHAGFRTFAGSMLAAEGFDVAGEVADGESVLAAVHALHPDVVLLDVQLPGMDGFAVALQLAEEPDPPRVVLTSSRDASDYGGRLSSSPVCGFIPKQEISGASLSALIDAA